MSLVLLMGAAQGSAAAQLQPRHLRDVVKHLQLLRLCKVQVECLFCFLLGLASLLGVELAVPMALAQEVLGPAGLLIAPLPASLCAVLHDLNSSAPCGSSNKVREHMDCLMYLLAGGTQR